MFRPRQEFQDTSREEDQWSEPKHLQEAERREQVEQMNECARRWTEILNKLILKNTNSHTNNESQLPSLGYRTNGKTIAHFYAIYDSFLSATNQNSLELSEEQYTFVRNFAENLFFIYLRESLEEDSDYGLQSLKDKDMYVYVDLRRHLFLELASIHTKRSVQEYCTDDNFADIEQALWGQIYGSPFASWQAIGYVLLISHIFLHDPQSRQRFKKPDKELKEAAKLFAEIQDKKEVGTFDKDFHSFLKLNNHQLLCALVDRLLQMTHVSGNFASRISSDPLSVFVFHTHTDKDSQEFLQVVQGGGFEVLEDAKAAALMQKAQEFTPEELGRSYPAFFHSLCLLAPANEQGWQLVYDSLVQLLHKNQDSESIRQLQRIVAAHQNQVGIESDLEVVAEYMLDNLDRYPVQEVFFETVIQPQETINAH